ncbi:hypothetical protein HPB52_020230 [Rhipicephalus sanguineus]|uniref:RanBP2-type domain-containing protein n=1 Tax=Rhipicephalus sanguineus TaxID=34632 RepID=A0A9D4STB4_RHISA|nr:hypothetical protein HPB52_020230 [Rhipicephalus sanguineus]
MFLSSRKTGLQQAGCGESIVSLLADHPRCRTAAAGQASPSAQSMGLGSWRGPEHRRLVTGRYMALQRTSPYSGKLSVAALPGTRRREVSHFGSGDNAPSPRPNSILSEDEENQEDNRWKCSKCTFLNHPALEACELCEMPKAPSSGNWGLRYLNLSPDQRCYCHTHLQRA